MASPKRYKTLLLSSILLPGFMWGYAQKADTTGHKKLIRSIKPAFDIDQRFSFIHNSPVNILGARAGIVVNENLKVGFGGYFLSNKLRSKTIDQSGTPFYFAKRDVYYGTFYFEPFLLRREYWELSIPLEIGFGRSYFKVYNGNNIFLGQDVKDFFPTGAGLSLSVKLPGFFGLKAFRWFGINFLAGYRYSILASSFKTDYDGMFWSISPAIFFDRMFDDCRYWKSQKRERTKQK